MENLLVFAVQTGSPLVSRNQDHAKSASAIGKFRLYYSADSR